LCCAHDRVVTGRSAGGIDQAGIAPAFGEYRGIVDAEHLADIAAPDDGVAVDPPLVWHLSDRGEYPVGVKRDLATGDAHERSACLRRAGMPKRPADEIAGKLGARHKLIGNRRAPIGAIKVARPPRHADCERNARYLLQTRTRAIPGQEALA